MALDHAPHARGESRSHTSLTLEFDPAGGTFSSGHLTTLVRQNVTALSCARFSAVLWNVSLTLVSGFDGNKTVVPLTDAFYRTDVQGGLFTAVMKDGPVLENSLQVFG